MKRVFYVTCFTFLGFLAQQLVHALIEIWYIGLLTSDFGRFGLGLSWSTWYTVHSVGTIVFLVCGIVLGFWQGLYWWPRLYDEGGKPRKRGTMEQKP